MPWRLLDLLTSRSHLLLSQPPPVSAAPCPVFPAPGPTPPPPTGSYGSTLPHRLQPEKHTGQGLICGKSKETIMWTLLLCPCVPHIFHLSLLYLPDLITLWHFWLNKQTWFNQEHVNHTHSRYVGLDIGSGAGLRHTVRTTLHPTLTDWHQSAEKA